MSAKSAMNALTKPFKQAGSEIARTADRLERENRREMRDMGKPFEEVGDVFSPDMPSPPATSVSDPVAIPEQGGDPMDTLRRRKRRSGQASTIQAGSLVPENIGYKNLLG